ncbi:CRISPR-associated endoribonuclease Cas6 [Desulfitibacter alkalitolerans]|uniref:CRISPR-associated endoribonuclease Cas6 n=1 Tax=Desulfitibacter alkalitolerans TaxID=264641 RepID=UPI0004850AF7|nr:CRISPR-associated endoribonuclease Cas6 [Desulfitibacter alkalitolerans]
MRIKVEFETKKEGLPLEFRRKFISYLKSAFEDYSQDLFAALYGGGHAPKSFCFSFYFLPQVTVAKDGITLDSKRFICNFTTRDIMMGVHLLNAFLGRRNRWVSLADWDNQLKVSDITKVQERPITGNIVAFKILSPVVIRDHDENADRDWYLTFEDEGFEEIWKRNLKSELQNTFARDVGADVDALQIKPIYLKKTVVLHYGISIPCTIGSFVVKGEKYLLEYLYKAGMGSRRAMAFGCLDLM